MTLTQLWYHMKIQLLDIIICQSLVKPQKLILEMIEPKIRILAQFRPDQAILQVIPHKKNPSHSSKRPKGIKVYEKNLAIRKIQQTLIH